LNERVWGVTLWEGGRGCLLTICESQGESDKEVTMGSRARKIFPQHVNGGGGALGVCFYAFSLTIFSFSFSFSLSFSWFRTRIQIVAPQISTLRGQVLPLHYALSYPWFIVSKCMSARACSHLTACTIRACINQYRQ
jgi:hypothetical protein